LYLIPWSNLYFPSNHSGEFTVPNYNLFTVTGYAIIYTEITGSLTNDSVPENKMILQHLVPDIGTIKTRWIYPPVVKRSVCFDSSEAHILTCINAAVNKLLESDQPDIQDVFTKSWNFIEKVLLEPKCDDKSILNYYKDLLHRVLWLSEKTITEIPIDEIFGGYQPKLTPDELYDYMPAIYDEVQRLPEPLLQNLPELLKEYKRFIKHTVKNRGKWVEGNVVLGANPKEYNPSTYELLLCDVGNRLQIIKETNQPMEIRKAVNHKIHHSGRIKFTRFSIIHYDVMGSGRFFYIGSIENVKFK
jgi:hypothetical protein